MTMAVPQPHADVLPACFGQGWDPREPECAGGPDPNYQARDGGHIRPQCGVFARCGARTTLLKQTAQVVPASSLVRPHVGAPPPATPPQAPPRTFPEYMARQNAEWVEKQRLSAMGAPRPAVAPTSSISPTFQHPYPSTVHSPATRYELNYTMPGYLTVPEERGQGESLWSVFFREIVRAMFKAVFHAGSHFMDTRRLKDPPSK